MHSITKDNQVIHLVTLLTIFFTVFFSFDVHAEMIKNDADPVGQALCIMIGILQYNITRIIGIIAIMGLGVLSLQGKLSWTISLIIVMGIIIIAKAPSIAGMIYGDNSQFCTPDDWSGWGASDVIGDRLCKILKLFKSNIIRAIAVIGIMILGMQSLKGAISWTATLMSVVGIILLFAAPNIYISIVGENSYNANCYGTSDNDK